MTTSCFSRLSLTKLYLAMQQNEPSTLTKPLWPFLICTHRSFPLLIVRMKQQNGRFSDCTCIRRLQRWPRYFSLLFSPPLDLLSTIFQFLYGQSTCVLSSWAWIQTSPYSQSYVVLRLGPPGLLTDFCRVLVGGKTCPGIWPCPPSVAG